MKTKKTFFGAFTFLMIAIPCCIMVLITNCSKKNNDQQSISKSKLKSDTIRIHKLPPQDSLNLIKKDFGQGILTNLQIYDSTITDFNILSDTIVYNTESTVAYLTTINCKGFNTKKVGITVNLPEKEKSTAIWVINFQICTCDASKCPCGCVPTWSGSNFVCPCYACYGGCITNCVTVPIIIW
jgi:hypothetical protein